MFDNFKNRMISYGSREGEARINHAKKIMNVSFMRDPAYKKCWILKKDCIFPQQDIDGYKKAKAVFNGYDSYDPEELSDYFEEIDTKYFIHTYYSIQGDSVDYYLQFRPDAHGYDENIRVGAFVLVPDDLNVYNLWLIVGKDDRPQFPQFYILKVNMLLKWYIGVNEIHEFEGPKVDTGTYYTWCVQRTQSSYNSGVWSDDYSTSVENQMKAILPTNVDTQTVTYNEHFIISNNATRRIAWEVTKVEDTTTKGLTKLTFAQQLEYDPVDNMSWINLLSEQYSDSTTGYDYDFYASRVHTYQENERKLLKLVCSGLSSTVKVGGGYKTLTAQDLSTDSKPSWFIKFVKSNNNLCNFSLKYINNSLICSQSSDDHFINDGTTIKYLDNGNEIFGIKFNYDITKSNCLKVKCLSIIDMIGCQILVSLDDSFDGDNTIILEVEGL